MNELLQLSQFISSFSLKDCPKNVIETAKYCVLDTIGVALSASDDNLINAIFNEYCSLDGNEGSVSIWGIPKKAPLKTAVFINGLMGHVMELDDVHTESKTHIGTVVIPAAWSLAEYLGSTGTQFLEAVICGYETMARIGKGFGVTSHRNKGWHVTGTAGTFGAAAACSKLLKLTPEKTLSALGLAGTQSSGLWAFLKDGATCKILHPARAAVNGLESAYLSKSGMTGSKHILDAEDGGLFPAASDEYHMDFVSEDLGIKFEIMNMDKKPYPCCRSTHSAIDAALSLCSENAISPDNIKSVNISTYAVGFKQCGASEISLNPKLPSDAKFSTPYTVACALINGKVDSTDFIEEEISSENKKALMKKISVNADPKFTALYPHHWGCKMIIEDLDGNLYEKTISDASGSVDSPLSEKQIIQKTSSLLTDYSEAKLDNLVFNLLNIDNLTELPRL